MTGVGIAGLPLPAQLVLAVALVVILATAVWGATLFVRGARAASRAPEPRPGEEDELTWIFVVPALNEEVTIADSVSRLLAVEVAHRLILVVDDGSDDRTPEVLRGIDHPDVRVLRRDRPQAGQGKAAALNAAYRRLDDLLPVVDRARAVLVVIDADGRLDPAAPRFAAAHFRDPTVGGVQCLVRMYNRRTLLTRMQHLEFAVYGRVYQAGKNGWGTAGLGGNGQFTRLSALDDVADEVGPWRDRLTEDQDLGLRMVAAGWKGRQDLRAVIDQQAVSNLRRLLRQRTRWSQGNLQAFHLARAVWRAPFPRTARIELLAYLFTPVWQAIVGLGLVVAVAAVATGAASILPTVWWQVPIVYVLGFGNTVVACLAARTVEGRRNLLATLVLAHVYALYTWLLWPVLARSVARELAARSDWAKTEREPVVTAPGPSA